MAIATLTIDLVAKLASLERDMGKAAQIAEKNARRMDLSLIHISEPTRRHHVSRMPSSA